VLGASLDARRFTDKGIFYINRRTASSVEKIQYHYQTVLILLQNEIPHFYEDNHQPNCKQ
jgi:hypothetical protein